MALKKIVHVVPYYWPAFRYGGPVWSVHGLCRAQANLGYEVEVLTTNMDGPKNLNVATHEVVELDGVKVRYFPVPYLRRLAWSPAMKREFPKSIASADFLHLHTIFQWPSFAAAKIAARFNVPWCIAPRGALVPEMVERKSTLIKKTWLSWFDRAMLEGASFIHATSELEAQDLQRFPYRYQHIEIVPNGVEFVSVSEASLPDELAIWINGRPLLLFLGRVSWKKGLDRLISALQAVPEAVLIVAGNDEENYTPALIDLATKVGVAERVRFIGAVQGTLKTTLLANASLLVLPSYSENFGNVILESLAQARPVAVTPEVGLAAWIAAQNVGVILPTEAQAMGENLAQLINNPSRLNEMGALGRDRVQQEYSWTGIAVNMIQAYQKAIDVHK